MRSPGEILGLIGPNGSGKSTIVNLVRPPSPDRGSRGARWRRYLQRAAACARDPWESRDVSRTSARPIAGGRTSGSHRTPVQRRQRFLPRWLGGSRDARAEIDRTLELFDLAHKRDDLAANLAFGEQRRLEFARALAARPALLLLDEPAAGMNAEEIDQLAARIRKLRRDGLTVLLIEHHVELVMSLADRVAVLNFGRKIAEGPPAAVQVDPAVREAYLALRRDHARRIRSRHRLRQDRSVEGRVARARGGRSPACSDPMVPARPR